MIANLSNLGNCVIADTRARMSQVATRLDVSSTQPLDLGRACLLVTGAPGAGKSTVSRLVAASLTRSALLDGYFVSGLVVSGRVWALGEPSDRTSADDGHTIG